MHDYDDLFYTCVLASSQQLQFIIDIENEKYAVQNSLRK